MTENLQQKTNQGSSRKKMRRIQHRTHIWQQKKGKKRCMRTKTGKPRRELARAVGPRGGDGTSSMTGSRRCTPLPQGTWCGRKRETGDQFDELKEANTVRGHSLKTHWHQSDSIKSSGTRTENGSYRPRKE